MKLFKKLTLLLLSLAFIAVSLDAANKRDRSEDRKEQPSAPKSQQVAAGQSAHDPIRMIYESAYNGLHTQFPGLATGGGPSTNPAITAEQLDALYAAADVLRMATSMTSRPEMAARLIHTDTLADDIVRAIESVVLSSREELMILAQAVDTYNDARSRAVARLRDAAIADELGRFRPSDDELRAYDAHIPELLMIGDVQPAVAPEQAAPLVVAPPADRQLAEGEHACAICLDAEDTTTENPMVWLGCCQNQFHKTCLIPLFTRKINELGVPECALCRTKIDATPAPLIGTVPTVNAINLLLTGALNGSVEYVSRALAMGVDINAQNTDPASDFHTFTALHIAAAHGHLPVVQFLWDNGANREALTANGRTPLHLAAHQGRLDVVTFLWNNGANREAVAAGGLTPLHLAVLTKHLPVVQFLWNDGANREALTADSATPLHLAVVTKHLPVVQFLWDNGANREALAAGGLTPLHLAAHQGRLPVVQFLWNHGANREAVVADGNTPLHLAADQGHLPVVQFLWDNGANREGLTANGNTPLHHAAQQGHLPVVQFLWDNGANREALTANGRTPLHLAVFTNHLPVVQFLWNNGANREALTTKGNTPLHLAVGMGHLPVVQFLWDNGANREALAAGDLTPLHLAAHQGRLPVVQFLWNHGANREAVVADGSTPLHLAADQGHLDVVTFLLEQNADVSLRDAHDTTALDLARINRHHHPAVYDQIIAALEAAAAEAVVVPELGETAPQAPEEDPQP